MLVEALRKVGIKPGDVIFSHISLGRLGYAEEGANIEVACNVLSAAFQEVLGETGTLLIPTYTYSIGKIEIYDVQETPSTVGPFTEYFRKLPGVIRSRDPMLAVSGIGPMAKELLTDLPRTCYGRGSLYDRMRKVGAKICNIGVSLYWATFRHHIEEMADVPFRFQKKFIGYIRDSGQLSHECWMYFAAFLIDNCSPDGMRLDKLARHEKICDEVKIGRSEIICINAQDYFDLGMKTLKEYPWFTAKGPPCDTAELLRLENERVGECEFKVEPLDNS
jgi:aminoglycoside 3-N-acetyltransferase